ncbi:carbohydrate kinase family protein [Actinokineospora iranica]|uniref:Sugar or nucleoside kinase, ribokinase family n=1 Tax=Actinokineospora iranica TaxID=1271860 RepID=A0A1G6QIL7_9PSEU|nr:carbohydrate kinase family protein [Actinokineospora iranica]SDC91485.1 Sugar or nucleoside kinase, ribokinase family [Actinokineospora iranica]
MPVIAVAGVVNIRMSCAVEEFPVPLISSRRLPNGLDMRLSGTGMIVARTAAALGSQVALATYVGADPLGLAAAQCLREEGFYGPGVQVCATQPRAMVLYDKAGTRSGTSDLRDTPALRYPAEVFAALVGDGCDLAVLTNIGFTRPLIRVAAERGIPFVTDLHVVDAEDSAHNREWMAAAHVLVCSHEALPHGPVAWIEAMWSRYGADLVVVGRGADGALLGVRTGSQVWHVAAGTPRGVRYVSGAGDTLVGSLAHHYAESGDPVSALRHAVLTAGWAIGGGPDQPRQPSAAGLAEVRAAHGLPLVRRVR